MVLFQFILSFQSDLENYLRHIHIYIEKKKHEYGRDGNGAGWVEYLKIKTHLIPRTGLPRPVPLRVTDRAGSNGSICSK